MNWFATWTAAPQLTEADNLPPLITDGIAFRDCTLRQTVRVSAGGTRLRLRLSNEFGAADLRLDAVRAGTSVPVCFGGRRSVTVPPGAQVISDPVEFTVADGASVEVTAYLRAGQPVADGITSHPGSRATSYVGDIPVEHWYYLSGIEVWSASVSGVAVMLGDSLTDGRGSTTDGNDRWPDQFFDLSAGRFAVVNQGVGGNRVLRDGLGPSALARLDTGVLAVTGARWLLVFEGINDIGTGADACDLIFGYEQIIARARAAGLTVCGATLTPFGGNDSYDDPEGKHEAARGAVNRWIRSGGAFDAVVDFDAAVRDPLCPRLLRPAFDTGDHLHMNPAGYRALARALIDEQASVFVDEGDCDG